MKKVLCIAAIAALVASSAFAATTASLRVVTTGDLAAASVAPGATVPVKVQLQLTGDATQGLALWGANVTTNGSTYVGIDLADTTGFLLTAPAGMASFVRNAGLTNPIGAPGDPHPKGYSGTPDGLGNLWQLGGGQNTIGNVGPLPPYPVGAVVTGIGNTGWVDVATGDLYVPAAIPPGGQNVIVLALDTAFANVIPTAWPTPKKVDPATASITGALTITVLSDTTPPAIVTAESKKTHTGVGEFGIDIKPADSVEMRTAGPTKLVVVFDEALVGSGVGGVAVPADICLNNSNTNDGTVSAAVIAGSTLTITMSGTSNKGRLLVTFPGIEDAAGNNVTGTLCICCLIGDTNATKITNSQDITAVKNNQGVTTALNFKRDINSSGAINSQDITATKNNQGSPVGTCPLTCP